MTYKNSDYQSRCDHFNSQMEGHYHQLYKKLGLEQGANKNFHCFNKEGHGQGNDKNASMSIDNKTGKWHCFTCGKKGNWQSYYREYIKPRMGINYLDFCKEQLGVQSTGNSLKNALSENDNTSIRFLTEIKDSIKKKFKHLSRKIPCDAKFLRELILEGYEQCIPVPDDAPPLPESILRGKKQPVACYRYADLDNKTWNYSQRYEFPDGKINLPVTLWRSLEGEYVWVCKGIANKDLKRPLYGAELVKDSGELPIIIVEGEKTANAGRETLKDKYLVLTWSNGVQSIDKFDWGILVNRTILIFPDNDFEGRYAAWRLAELLKSECDVKIIDIPEGVCEKWDIADSHPDGWGRKELLEHIESNTFEPLEVLKKWREKYPDENKEWDKKTEDSTENLGKYPEGHTYPFVIVKKYGDGDKSEGPDSATPHLKNSKLMPFLQDHLGIYKTYPEGSQESILIQITDGIRFEISPEKALDEFKVWIDSLPDVIEEYKNCCVNRDDVQEMFYSEWKKHIYAQNLKALVPVPNETFTGKKDCIYNFFKNGYIVVTATSITFFEYSTLPSDVVIDNRHVINRVYIPSTDENLSEFEILIACVTSVELTKVRKKHSAKEWQEKDVRPFSVCHFNGSNSAKRSFESSIGFLTDRKPKKSRARAVVINDAKLGSNPDENNGGTCKSIAGDILAQYRYVVRIDGKCFNPTKNQFALSRVDEFTDIIDFDDIAHKFRPELLYSYITAGIEKEQKQKDRIRIPFEKSPKIFITTNHVLPMEGSSAKRRFVEHEFQDYFDPEYTPRDEFGHELITDWDEKEWARCDAYIFRCQQLYLREGFVKSTNDGLNKRRLTKDTSIEFVQLMEETYCSNCSSNPWISPHSGTTFSKRKLFEGLNREQLRSELVNKHENQLSFEITVNLFTKWLKTFAKFHGLEYKLERPWIKAINGRIQINAITFIPMENNR